MSDFTIQELPEQLAVVSFHETDMAGFKDVVDTGFPALFDVLGQLAVPPFAPPFIRYLELGEVFSLQLGVPVAPGAALGDARSDVLPAGRAAVARHLGGYDGLEATGRALHDWVHAQGVTPRGTFWESYVTDPSAEPDSAKWVTDVVIPLTG